jgi:hypothetical protein
MITGSGFLGFLGNASSPVPSPLRGEGVFPEEPEELRAYAPR